MVDLLLFMSRLLIQDPDGHAIGLVTPSGTFNPTTPRQLVRSPSLSVPHLAADWRVFQVWAIALQ